VLDQVVGDLSLPIEAVAEVRKSGAPRLAGQLSWARLYLKFEGLVDVSARGVWMLTENGRATHLSIDEALAIVSHWDGVFRANGAAAGSRPKPRAVTKNVGEEARPITIDKSRRIHADEMPSIGDASWLTANGFHPVASWSSAAPKLQRRVPLRRARAVYAFVVNDRISYIGKATNVRGRLRVYNRSLLPEELRSSALPFRLVHQQIRETVESGGTVDVWIHEHQPSSADTVEALEAKWITEKRPEWNVVGIRRLP
jgi:hypothetical protein